MCFRCSADFHFMAESMDKVQARYCSQSLAFPDHKFDRYNDLYQPKEVFELRLPVCKSSSFTYEKDKFDEHIRSLEDRQLSVHIGYKLLTNDFGLIELSSITSKKIKKIELNYKIGMEEFSIAHSKWLKTRRYIIQELQRAEQRFRLIHRTTAGITFISSTAEFVSGLGLLLKNVINLEMNLSLINHVLTGISITSSMLALSYSRSILEDIARELREDKKQKEDLERVYKRGEWVDKAVQDLFPFGIDSNLLKDPILSQQAWRHTLCSAIILTNIKKDKTILNDQDFLPTVKAFADSPAAQIWVNRMKLRKLLDTTSYKCENISEKEMITSNTDVFLNRAAINLYPVLSPLLTKSGNTEHMRFLFSSIAAVITALDFVDKGQDKFHEMEDTILTLKEEYRKIRKINNSLISDYD